MSMVLAILALQSLQSLREDETIEFSYLAVIAKRTGVMHKSRCSLLQVKKVWFNDQEQISQSNKEK